MILDDGPWRLALRHARQIIFDSLRHGKRAPRTPAPTPPGSTSADAVGGRVRYSPGRLTRTCWRVQLPPASTNSDLSPAEGTSFVIQSGNGVPVASV